MMFFFVDLTKLYKHKFMSPAFSPAMLQTKVQFNVCYYFCRRGGENIYSMTKDTFELKFDLKMKIAYVKKKRNELTKNRQEYDSEVITGFMPQMKDAMYLKVHDDEKRMI